MQILIPILIVFLSTAYDLLIAWRLGLVLCNGFVKGDLMSNCVTPPLECPNINITFWLYTRSNKDDPFEINALDPESIKSAPWVKNAIIKVLIHGYTGHKEYSPNTEIRPAFLKCCNHNILSVDYNKIALEPCYMQAAQNTELVGMCTAQLIDQLVLKYGFELAKFHIIGFSLGGQVAGFIGNYIKLGQLDRITALDPALPLFATKDKRGKIDSGDANFVDCLHTNALRKGKLECCGDVDFFPNGGSDQPGCKETKSQTKSSCDHARAPAYYAESVLTETGFYGTKCPSWIYYIIGWCQLFPSTEELIFGEYVPRNASGIYFFNTNSEPPYALGSKQKENSTR